MASDRSISKGYGKEFLASVREWKTRRDQDTSPLVDGTLPNGPWDESSLTVAMATKDTEGWKTLQLLHSLTVLHRPRTILEMGTAVGFSSAYLAAGQKASGQDGTLHTIEASPYRVRLADELHRFFGLDNIHRHLGLFDDVLPGLLRDLESIDMAFIDGNHYYKPTLRYFDLIAPKCPEGALVVFDDIASYSGEMRKAWLEIQGHPRVYTFSEINQIGIVVLNGVP